MMNDKEIEFCICECLDGKRESFSRIIDFFQKSIYNFCYNILHTSQDAEDAVLEIFLKVYKSLPAFKIQYKFSTWLYKIAFNHLIEIIRKKKREKKYLESEFASRENTIESKTPPVVFFEKLEKKRITEMIHSLPIEYKTALILRYFHELSYQQISEIMEMPRNTVGSLIWRGKKELREKYYKKEG